MTESSSYLTTQEDAPGSHHTARCNINLLRMESMINGGQAYAVVSELRVQERKAPTLWSP